MEYNDPRDLIATSHLIDHILGNKIAKLKELTFEANSLKLEIEILTKESKRLETIKQEILPF